MIIMYLCDPYQIEEKTPKPICSKLSTLWPCAEVIIAVSSTYDKFKCIKSRDQRMVGLTWLLPDSMRIIFENSVEATYRLIENKQNEDRQKVEGS